MLHSIALSPTQTAPHLHPTSDIRATPAIEDVVPEVMPPMEFKKWLELIEAYAQAASRRRGDADATAKRPATA